MIKLKSCLNFITSTVFILIALSANAQPARPDSLIKKLGAAYPYEKIFIHFDKENYIAGETIWFKAYITAAYIPSVYSTSIGIDLLTDSGTLISKKVLPVLNGVAAGNIDLDTALSNANYTIRAYTQLMMTAGEDKCYSHSLTIFNTNKKITKPAVIKPEIYFLPEGGNIVAGLVNTIAFKSSDQWGYPLNVTVKLTTAKGEEVTNAVSVHDGMGQFMYIPVAGERYFAECKFEGYQPAKIELPPALPDGIVLTVKDHVRGKIFAIEKTENLPVEMQPGYVLGIIENKIVFRADLKQDKEQWLQVIPTKDIPSGILQLTVFSTADKPLAERLTFINREEYLEKGNFKAGIFSKEARGKNEFSYELTDTLEGTYSVAVTDVDKEIAGNGVDDIVPRMLLTNDVKGYVYQPAYYFKDAADKDINQHLELVLMTNGWRRYSWDAILKNNIPTFSNKDDFFITVAGTAKKENSKKPFENDEMIGFITTKDSAERFVTIPINKDGIFKIEGMIFNDTATLILQNNAKKYKDQALKFNITNSSSLFNKMMLPYSADNYKIRPLTIADAPKLAKIQTAVLNNYRLNNASLLPDVIVRSKMKSATEKLEDKYVSGFYSSMSTRTLDFINDPLYKTDNGMFILDYLRGRVPGVDVGFNTEGEYQLSYRNSGMYIYLDEMPSDATALAAIPANQIALIKVYATFVASSGGSGPAIAVYTKRGNDVDYNGIFSPVRKLKVAGYSPVKQFFSPDYSKPETNINRTDNRATLYWNPYITTGADSNKISFSFYNNDTAKKLRIIIQGFTLDGQLVNFEKVVE